MCGCEAHRDRNARTCTCQCSDHEFMRLARRATESLSPLDLAHDTIRTYREIIEAQRQTIESQADIVQSLDRTATALHALYELQKERLDRHEVRLTRVERTWWRRLTDGAS